MYLKKSHFFRLVLELFWNSEFLTSDFLDYNISGCPLFGSPICEKILPHLGRPCVLEKCENVLEMFWNCSGFFKKILLATLLYIYIYTTVLHVQSSYFLKNSIKNHLFNPVFEHCGWDNVYTNLLQFTHYESVFVFLF